MEHLDGLEVIGGLLGRNAQLSRLLRFVSVATEVGMGLIVRGESGIGKTVLLDTAAEVAKNQGVRVLRGGGVEFEADLAFSGLHELLLPIERRIGDLQERLSNALLTALGFAVGPPPDRLLLANAVLDLLRKEATNGPILVIVDDLQWIDRSSAAIIGTVARRLTGIPVGFIGAIRDDEVGFFDRSGLPELEVSSLSEHDSIELLNRHNPGISPYKRWEILRVSGGNPLAIIELVEATKGSQMPGLGSVPVVLPLTKRLRGLFTSRLSSLPEETRKFLLLAVVEGTGDLRVLQQASGGGLTHLERAEQSRLVTVDLAAHRLVFRHPLIRSAVIDSASFAERQRAHRRLAEFLDDQPDRKTWHLAEATLDPDEDVARLLEQSSYRRLARGDAVGAVAALSRAADLSPRRSDRARRLAEAAYFGAAALGEVGGAAQLLEDARRSDPDFTRSVESAMVAAYLQISEDGSIDTAHHLLAGALELNEQCELDPEIIQGAVGTLWTICMLGSRSDLWEQYDALVWRFTSRITNALLLLSRTWSDPVRTATSAAAEVEAAISQLSEGTDGQDITIVGGAAHYVDLLADCRPALWRVIRDGRAGGAMTLAINAMSTLCSDDFESGNWDECSRLAAEMAEAVDASGLRFFVWLPALFHGLVAAGRGDFALAERLAADMVSWGRPRGANATQLRSHQIHALIGSGKGNFQQTYTAASAISPPGTFPSHVPEALRVMIDLVEAATKTDRGHEASAHVEAMYAWNIPAISPRMLMITNGCAGVVAETRQSYELFQCALNDTDAARWCFDRARLQLLYGERLRRDRELREARVHLGQAFDTFSELGARPWMERASIELRATGESRPGSRGSRHDVLTPQEREIAELAAAGMSNKEIAERLFLSHRTVASHLYKIFPKLGITSRAALRDALAS
jgi:DNA-binding CsgD family transcriptional regulator